MGDEKLTRYVRRAFSRLGVGREIIRAYDHLPTDKNIRSIPPELIGEEIKQFSLADSEIEGKVLIPLVQSKQIPNSYKYCILAHAFYTRGFEPVIPVCYNHLHLCHEKTFERDDRVVCDDCNFQSVALLNAFGLEVTSLDEFVPQPPDIHSLDSSKLNQSYKSVEISKYALGSARKFLKKYHIDSDNPVDMEVYTRFLDAAKYLVDAATQMVNKYNFDAVVAHDPNYVYGGIFLAVAEKHGIPAYSSAWAFNNKKIIFGRQRNQMATPEFTDEEFVKSRLTTPLTSAEKGRIDHLMEQRRRGDNTSFDYSARTEAVPNVEDGTQVGMFTNLIWDDSLNFDADDLMGYFEWIDNTIDYFAGKQGCNLIIKLHPAESVHGTNESVGEYITEQFNPLPNNVRLLAPDTDIDTYELIANIDAGIVYNSTVGLEMAFIGTPAIVTGATHYRGHGFTFDVSSAAEYHETLQGLDQIRMSPDMVERSERYAYLLFCEKQIDFPYVTFTGEGEHGYDHNLHPVTHDETKPGNETFDKIVNAIVNNRTVTS